MIANENLTEFVCERINYAAVVSARKHALGRTNETDPAKQAKAIRDRWKAWTAGGATNEV